MKKVIIKQNIIGRLAFQHIFEPAKPYGDETKEPVYSFVLLIKKNDKQTIAKINEKIEQAIEKGIKEGIFKEEQVKGKNFHIPLKDGDDTNEKPEYYRGHYHLNVKRNLFKNVNGEVIKPEIVIEENGSFRKALTSEIYNGCYVNACITFHPFNRSGALGISLSFIAVLKYQDGEQIGSVMKTEEIFKGCKTVSNNSQKANDVDQEVNEETDDELLF